MTPPRTIVLLGLITVANCGGCQVLGLPSYRIDDSCATMPVEQAGAPIDYCHADACEPTAAGPIRNSSLPVPGWLAKWQAQRDLPEPPPYPRFQPLPTRPMFAPR